MKKERKIIYLYTHRKMSISDVSKKIGVPKSTVRYWLNKNDQCRSIKEGFDLARHKLGKQMLGKNRVFTKEWRSNISKSKTGKGLGLSTKPSGYIEITMGPNKGRSQHRAMMEQELGRKLLKSEIVHHANGIKSDNRIKNFILTNPSDHSRYHALERVSRGVNFDISSLVQKGESHPRAILTNKQVIYIRENHKAGKRGYRQKMAIKFGVSKSCISHILSNKNWK